MRKRDEEQGHGVRTLSGQWLDTKNNRPIPRSYQRMSEDQFLHMLAIMHCQLNLVRAPAATYIQQMYEGRGNNDTCAKIPSEQVDIDWDPQSRYTFGDDGKEGSRGGTDEDYKERRNPGTKLTIVFIFGGVQSANDLSRVGNGEVDTAGIESWITKFAVRHDCLVCCWQRVYR